MAKWSIAPDRKGVAAMTTFEKVKVQDLLEEIWDYYAYRFTEQRHDLVVLAIPREPSNIEAIAALDVTTIRMALRQFMNAREIADERPPIRASEGPGEAKAETAGSGLQHELDARSDPAGPSAQPADPADEQGQGDAAAGAVEDGGRLTEPQRAMLRLIRRSPSAHADGWRDVSEALWPMVQTLPGDLVELLPLERKARLTASGYAVTKWL